MKIVVSSRVPAQEVLIDLFGADSGWRSFQVESESMTKDRQCSNRAVSQNQRRTRLHKSRKN